MFGTEYTWLVSLTRSADGSPRVRMAGGGMITLLVAIFCVVTVAVRAGLPPQEKASVAATQPVVALIDAMPGSGASTISSSDFPLTLR